MYQHHCISRVTLWSVGGDVTTRPRPEHSSKLAIPNLPLATSRKASNPSSSHHPSGTYQYPTCTESLVGSPTQSAKSIRCNLHAPSSILPPEGNILWEAAKTHGWPPANFLSLPSYGPMYQWRRRRHLPAAAQGYHSLEPEGVSFTVGRFRPFFLLASWFATRPHSCRQ